MISGQTMTDRRKIFDQIESELRRRIVPSLENEPISDDTELYRDLGMYGYDIVELIHWIHEQFGVQYLPDVWGPPELPFLSFRRLFRRFFGLEEPYYPSPKVGDIVNQIYRNSQQPV